MARVEIASMPWGVLQDRNGNARSESATLKNLDGSNATTWSAASGGSSSTASLTADANGTLPRFIDGGTYMQDVPALGVSGRRVEAVSGAVESGTVGLLNAGGFSGVDRTGVADSATGLGSALTAGAGRGLILPYGTYKVLSALSIPAAGMTLQFDDAVLDFTGLATAATALTALGTLGTPVTVNAVAFGATQITGSAGIETGLGRGDQIKLWSADIFDPGQTNSTDGEQCVVLSTASGVINIYGTVMGSYSTTVKIAKVTPSRLTIKGTGQILMGGSGSQHRALRADFANGLRIEGPKLEIRGAENAGIQLYDSTDFEIGYVDIDGSTNASSGYGASIANTCQNGRVHHSHISNCRHWTSVNTSTINNGGIPRHITFEEIFGRYTPAACDGFDAHAGAEYLTYDVCEGRGCGNSTFNIECPSATVKNSKSFGSANHAVTLLATGVKGVEYRVTNNEFWDSAAMGVRYAAQVGLASPAPITLDILDNVAVRCATAACWADPGAEHRIVGARMLRNRAYDCGGSGTRVFWMTKADGCEMDNHSFKTPNGIVGSRVDDFTDGYFGGLTSYASGGTLQAFRGLSVVNTVIRAKQRLATGVGGKGLELDAASSGCIIDAGGLRGATTPLALNGISHTVINDGQDAQVYSTDANVTLTPFTSAKHLIHTATLTASRTVPISTTGAYPGMRFRVTRTGGGAFNLTVGGVKVLTTGQWVDMTFDGSAWVASAFGSL